MYTFINARQTSITKSTNISFTKYRLIAVTIFESRNVNNDSYNEISSLVTYTNESNKQFYYKVTLKSSISYNTRIGVYISYSPK